MIFCVRHDRLAVKVGQDLIGGRAARTPFARKQLDQDVLFCAVNGRLIVHNGISGLRHRVRNAPAERRKYNEQKAKGSKFHTT
jgi:hypothetical protein